MKRVLTAIAVLAVALVGVLAINTLRFASRQLAAQPSSVPAIDPARAAEHLAGALRIQTVSYPPESGLSSTDPFLELHHYLEQTFPRVHSTLRREVVNGFSLLYTWSGSDAAAPAILLAAHQDVVPVEPETATAWSQPPFGGKIAGGFVWGRGAWDDKASLIGILEAVEALLNSGFQPRQTIHLAFGHDEELGGHQGAARVAALLADRGVRLEFVLDEGMVVIHGILPGLPAPVAMIGTAEKGYVTIELVAAEASGHSSMPPARTAIGVLSTAITRLEAAQMPGGITGVVRQMFEHVGPEMPLLHRVVLANLWLFGPLVARQMEASPATNAMIRTTTAPTVFQSGAKDNVLPLRARAVVNFRVRPGHTVDAVVGHVRETIGDPRVRVTAIDSDEPSAESRVDARGFTLVARAARQVFPAAVVTPSLVVAATDSRHYQRISDNVYRFVPVVVRPEDLARVHGVDERIAVDNYLKIVEFYERLITAAAL